MFYEPKSGHPFPHDPFKAIVAPRPIGWVSTIDREGRPNLAPYSFFNAFGSDPPFVGFSSEGLKHSAGNARETGEFVFNLATLPMVEAVNLSSADFAAGVNEFERAGLAAAPCRLVRPPRVSGSPASLECRVVHVLELKTSGGNASDRWLVIGEVIGVHIDEAFVTDGRFDTLKAKIIARCGYKDFSVLDNLFEMGRPRVTDVT